MKLLLQYLKPYKWLVTLVLFLAAINTGFSLVDPIIFGKLINLANEHQILPAPQKQFTGNDYCILIISIIKMIVIKTNFNVVVWLLMLWFFGVILAGFEKTFQDYFLNVVIQKFGAKIF